MIVDSELIISIGNESKEVCSSWRGEEEREGEEEGEKEGGG